MNKHVKSNSIRIISGQWRGRKLNVLDVPGLRPTSDRVRETLFNWLMYEVPGKRCLDLFAGSGALGFESLSRGASFVSFVELDKKAARSIESALKLLSVEAGQSTVTTAHFEAFLATKPQTPYDVVFLDPPFGLDYLPAAIKSLSTPGWLSENAFVYIEQAVNKDYVEVPLTWELFREGKTGQSRYRLYTLDDQLSV